MEKQPFCTEVQKARKNKAVFVPETDSRLHYKPKHVAKAQAKQLAERMQLHVSWWAPLVRDCDRQTTVLCGRHKLKEGLAKVANSNFLKSSRASPVAHLLLRSTNFSCDLESAIDAFLLRLRPA